MADIMSPKRTDNFPRTVEKALTLLEHIAMTEKPIGISELSNKLDISKSTVYRILQTLLAKEYIKRDSMSNKYQIGIKILELNTAIVKNMGLRTVAIAYMEKLAAETLETVGLAIMDKEGVIYVDQTGGEKENVRIHFPIGAHIPFHCTGTGKAMLAFLDEEEMEEILKRHELKAYTANTITDIGDLRNELKKIGKEGYAFNNGEFEDVIKVVAAPIFDSRNKVAGSLAVAALSSRLDLSEVPRFGRMVKRACAEISRNLGFDSGSYNP